MRGYEAFDKRTHCPYRKPSPYKRAWKRGARWEWPSTEERER
jgi:hypothetical protein